MSEPVVLDETEILPPINTQYIGNYVAMVTALLGGGFAAVYLSDPGRQGINDSDVLTRVFDAAGNPIGPLTTVGITDFSSEENLPTIVATRDGGYVVAWTTIGSDTGDFVYVARFTANGTPIGSRIEVAADAVSVIDPHLAALPGGGFAITYGSTNTADPLMRIFNTQGVGGGVIAVNRGTQDRAGENTVTALSDGTILVTWISFSTVGSSDHGILAQVFTAGGAPVGNRLLLSPSATFHEVVALGGGNFALVHDGYIGQGDELVGRIFTATGSLLGQAFQINETVTGAQQFPITFAVDDGFVVAWSQYVGESAEIRGRQFAADGSPTTREFHISENSYVANGALLADGRLIFAVGSPKDSPGYAGNISLSLVAFLGPNVFVNEFHYDNGATDSGEAIEIAGAAGISLTGWSLVLYDGATGAAYRTVSLSGTIADAGNGFGFVSVTAPDLRDGRGGIAIVNERGGMVQFLSYGGAFTAAGGAAAGFTSRDIGVTEDASTAAGRSLQLVGRGDQGSDFGWAAGTASFGAANAGQSLAANRAPAAAADTLTVATGNTSTLLVLANDSDPDSNTIAIDAVTAPAHGTVTIAADSATLSYTPTAGYTGSDSFTYTISDGASGFSTATVTLNVVAQSFGATPAGGETLVNTTTQFSQSNPAVATLAGGGSVVTWVSDGQDGSGQGVYAQRYAADGQRVGGETLVPVTTANDQRAPVVEGLPGGGFVVAWEGRTTGSQGFDVYVRRFAADGTPAGGETIVNTTLVSAQLAPAITVLPGGGYVVTWQTTVLPSETTDVIARVFRADGTALTGEIAVNTTLASNQDVPVVATLGNGFVIAWTSIGQDGGGEGIYLRRFAADGTPTSGEVLVNTVTTGNQRSAAITELSGGGFAVAWAGDGIRAQLYDSAGARVGGELTLNASGTVPALTALAASGFAASWSAIFGGSASSVESRLFDAAGAPLGDRFVVNETTTGAQTGGPGSLVQLADGTVLYGWSGAGVGDAGGVFVRRFTATGAAAPGPTAGDDTLFGTASGERIDLHLGGADTAFGDGGSDGFYMGTALDNGDRLYGGAGDDDQVIVQGNYTGANAIVLTAQVFTGIETLAIQPGNDARFGDTSGALYSYDITLSDANVAAGARLIVNANRLRVGENVTFDGSAETNGAFSFYMAAGNDRLIGGAGADQFYGRLGADRMTGGGGNDVFVYRAAAESTDTSRDTITDFTLGDRIDLSFFDANIANGSAVNDAFAFIGSAAFTAAGQLRATNTGGANWLIEGDVNGDGTADLVIAVTTTGGHAIIAADFVL